MTTDQLISGPYNLNSLAGVLMRFRQGRIPIASDVKQVFHQISIRQDDKQAQRFLWRDMDTTTEPETYQMNVVIFGAKFSPCTAMCSVDVHTMGCNNIFRQRARCTPVSMSIVDDYLDSVDTESEGR